jgi:hypothetical protein
METPVATVTELNSLTTKELGSIAKNLSIAGWYDMRKEELVHVLVLKSRTKNGRDLIQKHFSKKTSAVRPASEKPKTEVKKSATVSKMPEKSKSERPTPVAISPKKHVSAAVKPSPTPVDAAKDSQRKREVIIVAKAPKNETVSEAQARRKLRRDISTQSCEEQKDQLVLLVRDPFWLHAFWELNPKTVERAKVAMGMFWHTALPVIRLFRLESDGASQPKRVLVRDILIHGGVNNWYLDVMNPPSTFLIEIGYISREKNFYPLLSSNTVTTPQQQLIDNLDRLDGNWRGVAEDLDRIYKLSSSDANNQELKKVFEEKLHRPMSAPLLSRYRASQQQSSGLEKTRRNFGFNLDVDLIVHGKTDPGVQVAIRNEPLKMNPDGSFTVRFSLPEKRHVFPIEAESSDGVETQRMILTVERNTRNLETLFQETVEDSD